MRVLEVGPKPGRVWELEVSGLLSRWRLVARLLRIPDVRIVDRPGAFSWLREGVFCVFEYQGRRFVAEKFEGDAFQIRPERRGCIPELQALGMQLIARSALRYAT
ncbi:MAG: hypothetical protein J0L58_07585 [Burkholderiales bacterium]|nr:hypothetical protein [Burkholderiales bacterium]